MDLVWFMLAALGCLMVGLLVVDLAVAGDVLRAVAVLGRRRSPSRLAVPAIGLLLARNSGAPWSVGISRSMPRMLVDHAAWGAVVDLVDRGVLRTGSTPGQLVLPPTDPLEDPYVVYATPRGLARWERVVVGSAAFMSEGEHPRYASAHRVAEAVANDKELWDGFMDQLVEAGHLIPLKRVRLSFALTVLLVLAMLVVVYWQLVADVGAGGPVWVAWLVGILTPLLVHPVQRIVAALVEVLDRQPMTRLIRLARQGIGYDYPARPGIVVALDGVHALARTHPDLASRLGIQDWSGSSVTWLPSAADRR
jgi:hypothetical protein